MRVQKSFKAAGIAVIIGMLMVTGLLTACSQSASTGSTTGSQPESKPPASQGSKPAESAKPEAAKPPAKAEKLTLAYATVVVAHAIPRLANAAGFFKDVGLDVETLNLQGGSATSAAIVAGDIQAVAGGANEVIDLMNQNKRRAVAVYSTATGITMFAAVSNAWIQKNGIDLNAPVADRIKKLKGAAFGAPSLGGTTEMYIWLILQQGGLKKGDADVVRTGGGAAQVAALEAGQIDAVVASPPSPIEIEARGKGRVIVSPKDLPGLTDYPNQVVYVPEAWAKEHPDAVKKLIVAMEKARQMIKDNPAEATRRLKSEFPEMSDDSLLKSVQGLQDNLVRAGKMTEQQWQSLGPVMMATGELKQPLPSKTEGVIWTNEYFQ